MTRRAVASNTGRRRRPVERPSGRGRSVLGCDRRGKNPLQLRARFFGPGVRKPLQLAQVSCRDRPSGEQVPRPFTALIQQCVELVQVAADVGQVRQAVQGRLVALVGQRAQGVPIRSHVCHGPMLQPCPWGKVKCDHEQVITIGQLARYAGVTIKTVRVYHAKGLLPEPDRDSSGYRRYTAQHAIDLIKIRTIADAGVPLARIRDLRASPDTDLREVLQEVDAELTARIRGLRRTQRNLRRLAAGDDLLPAEVSAHLDRLREYGFSGRWVSLQGDLWVLLFATHPETAADLLHDQAQALTEPARRQIFLDYDRVYDLDPRDPFIEELADRMVNATRDRYGSDDLPGQDVASDIPTLIQADVNASSPAWRRLDALVRRRLR